MEDKPAPIACDLHKLTAAERERRRGCLMKFVKLLLKSGMFP